LIGKVKGGKKKGAQGGLGFQQERDRLETAKKNRQRGNKQQRPGQWAKNEEGNRNVLTNGAGPVREKIGNQSQ